MMSVKDVCRHVGLSKSTLCEEFRAGRLRSVKVGSRRMVLPADLDAWIEELPSGGKAWK